MSSVSFKVSGEVLVKTIYCVECLSAQLMRKDSMPYQLRIHCLNMNENKDLGLIVTLTHKYDQVVKEANAVPECTKEEISDLWKVQV